MLSLMLILLSCDKKYTYIETIKEKSLLGNSYTEKERDPDVIKAKNDTLAYLQAYRNFCISLKVYDDMKKKGSASYFQPINFKILNENGSDITNIDFVTKKSQHKIIMDCIFELGLPSDSNSIENKAPKIDSTKVKELSNFFNIKSDEFSENNVVWYTPKSAPKYTNRNGIYCYIRTSNGLADALRLVIQYYADDWLFFDQIKFSIDDNVFSYYPVNYKRDNGDGYIWEWVDDILSSDNREIIVALSKSKQAKMKFIGDKYYDVKTITRDQCKSIERVLEMYVALGGKMQ